MATYREYSIARANTVEGLAEFEILGQTMKGLVEFGQVAVSLLAAPRLFGEYRNALQIGSGYDLDFETRHW